MKGVLKTRSDHIQTSGFTWVFRSSTSHQRPGNGQVVVSLIAKTRLDVIYINFNIYVEIEKCIGDNSANFDCGLFGKGFQTALK